MVILKRLAGDMAVAAFILFVIGSAYFITAQRILFQQVKVFSVSPQQIAMQDSDMLTYKYVARLREEEHRAIRAGKGADKEG